MNQRLRALVATQGAVGAVIAARPAPIVAAVSGTGAHPAGWIVRVLGARMAVQAALTLLADRQFVVRAGVAADVLHSVSMLAVSARWPRYRRPALASALVAASFAAAEVACE